MNLRSGIGWMSPATMELGFVACEVSIADAGKTMGLAAYSSTWRRLLTVDCREGFSLDFAGFIIAGCGNIVRGVFEKPDLEGDVEASHVPD